METPKQKSRAWQQWLFAFLIIAFLWVVYSHLTEIQRLAQVLRQGKLAWVFVAALLQACYFLGYAYMYHFALLTVEVPSQVGELLRLAFAAVFVDSTAPSGGVAGKALFVDAARRRGESAARAAAGAALVLAVHYGVFALILTGGLWLILQRGGLTSLELISAVLLFLLVGGTIGVLLLGAWRAELLYRLLIRVQALINWLGKLIRRPSLVASDWAQVHGADFAAAGAAIRQQPARLGYTVAAAAAVHLLNILSLAALFLAFNLAFDWSVILASYSMSILFLIVSPTPNGVGVVETVMPLIYTSLGVAPEQGTIVNLAFRGLSFWLPLLIGFFSLRRLRLFDSQQGELSRSGQVRLIAVFSGFVGLIDLLTAVSPSLVARLEGIDQFVPLLRVQGGHLTTVLSGFVLLVLAPGLWHNLRLAWRLLLATLLVSAAAHLIKGYDYPDAFLSLLIAGYLWTQRAYFHETSTPPTLARGIGALVSAAAFTLIYSTAGIFLLEEWFQVETSLGQSWAETANLFIRGGRSSWVLSSAVGSFFVTSVYVVAGVTICLGIGLLIAYFYWYARNLARRA